MKKHDDVVKIKESVQTKILKLFGVTGIDVGYVKSEDQKGDEMVIRIYVASLQDLPDELAGIREIEGVRVVLIERRFELH